MYCPKCGAECQDDAEFCPKCGESLKGAPAPSPTPVQPQPQQPIALTYREIITVILLSIVTCGIYTIYWFYTTTNELNEADTGGEPITNFIIAMLLGIVTCGIYEIYWFYVFFKKLDYVTNDDNWILNFVLSIFLTPIVGIAIAQNTINKCVDNKHY